jgi:glutaminase
LLGALKEWAPVLVVAGTCVTAYFVQYNQVSNNTAQLAEIKQENIPTRMQTLEDGLKSSQQAQNAQNQALQSQIQALESSQHDTTTAVTSQGQTLASISSQLTILLTMGPFKSMTK